MSPRLGVIEFLPATTTYKSMAVTESKQKSKVPKSVVGSDKEFKVMFGLQFFVVAEIFPHE
jgi:hypothetical protein